MDKHDAKWKQLVFFLDKKAFDPILNLNEGEFSDRYRHKFRDVQKSTENEKRRFHQEYDTAEDVKKNYLIDLNSKTAQKKNAELHELGLPQLPQFRDEFLELCKKLGV
jgi:hypothetical protein